MNKEQSTDNKILLHACCGPCSLEPIRIYREQGIEPTIFFSNSNIAPKEEYRLRRDTIRDYCKSTDVEFVEDIYDNQLWTDCVKDCITTKTDRCRHCYKMRFQRCCNYAHYNGFKDVSTTLTISPYQFQDIIFEELMNACEEYGLRCAYTDFSKHYYDAQKRAKELGLYRQHYCGCIPSKLEAEQELTMKKEEKQRIAEVRQTQLDIKRKQKSEYAAKRAKQKQILDEIRKRNKETC